MTRRRNKAVGAAGARRERAGGAAPPEPPAPPAGPGLPESPEAAAAAAAAGSSAEQGRASQVPRARVHISPCPQSQACIHTPLLSVDHTRRIHLRRDPPFTQIPAALICLRSSAFIHPWYPFAPLGHHLQ